MMPDQFILLLHVQFAAASASRNAFIVRSSVILRNHDTYSVDRGQLA
jgi:hypothetical protein